MRRAEIARSSYLVAMLFATTVAHGTLSAQDATTNDGAQLSAGAGVAHTRGGTVATTVGPAVAATLTVPLATRGGLAVRARTELRFTHQPLRAAAASSTTGDVQTVASDLAVRVASTRRHRLPYLVAGGGVARVSTRLDAVVTDPTFPTISFSQTTSVVVPTTLLGIGLDANAGALALFAEARLHFEHRREGTAQTRSAMVGIRLPLRR